MTSGLLMVYTSAEGNGTLAAFGQAFRALGRGLKVCIVQFGYGAGMWHTIAPSDQFRDLLEVHVCPSELGLNPAREAQESHAAADMWQLAQEKMESGLFQIMVLEGLATMVSQRLVPEREAVNALTTRPEELTVVVTGRNASRSLLDAADLVTDMVQRKKTSC